MSGSTSTNTNNIAIKNNKILIVRHPLNDQHDIQDDCELIETITSTWNKRKHEFKFVLHQEKQLQNNNRNAPSPVINDNDYNKLLEQGIVLFRSNRTMLSIELLKQHQQKKKQKQQK